MRSGERYLLAFFAGNALFAALSQLFTPNPLLLLITIATLMTISFGIVLKSGWSRFNPHLALIIFLLLGVMNGTREWRPEGEFITQLRERVSSSRDKIVENICTKTEKIIKNREDQSIILAFTIGYKEQISNQTKEYYKESGAMHVLALSGLHIGIIYGIIELILFFLNFSYSSRQLKLFICSSVIFIYVVIGNFSPSIMRAAIMITLHNIVKVCNRRERDVFYLGRERRFEVKGRWICWLCSASIILLINPKEISDVGFQLSFAAVAGIILLYRPIKESYNGRGVTGKIWEIASISTACQISTLPFALYYFNSSPIYYLITNITAIPLVTLSIYSYFIAYITYGIPYIGELTSAAACLIIRVLNSTVEFIGS